MSGQRDLVRSRMATSGWRTIERCGVRGGGVKPRDMEPRPILQVGDGANHQQGVAIVHDAA